jgi:hypothetical protein
MQATDDTLQMPLNRASFRDMRNFQLGTVCLGCGMVAIVAAAGVYAVYELWADPAHQSTSVLLLFLSLLLTCGIGAVSLFLLRLTQRLSKTLKENLPALCISQAGIEDNASDSPLGLLRWEEIENVTISSRYAQSIRKRFPGVVIVFKDGLQTSGRPYLNAAGMTPRYAGKKGVFIPQGRIAMPIEDVVEQINAFRGRITP